MKKEKILILFGADSRLEWGRSYQLAKAFSAIGHDVLYIDLPEPADKSLFTCFKKTRMVSNNMFEVYQPTFGLPYGRFGFLRMYNMEHIYMQIIRYLTNKNFTPTILWTYSPYEPEIARRLKEKFGIEKIVYDCADDRVAYARTENGIRAGRTVERLEKELCSYCSGVISITDNLKTLKSELHSRNIVIPNGIDTDMFNADYIIERTSPYQGLSGKIILNAGTVGDWIDQELLVQTALLYPEHSFVYVGPVRVDVSKLKKLPNVFFYGKQKYNKMPIYMCYADICIVPFKDNEITRSCDSLKTLQYLAMGKPVLSTKYGGLNDYHRLVSVASSCEEFVEMLGQMIEKQVLPSSETLSEVLNKYAWRSLAKEAIQSVYKWS